MSLKTEDLPFLEETFGTYEKHRHLCRTCGNPFVCKRRPCKGDIFLCGNCRQDPNAVVEDEEE